MEIWKPVVGFEGSYEVSDLGRVRSVSRRIPLKSRWGTVTSREVPARMMKLVSNTKRGGRVFLVLHLNGKQHMRIVSNLVAAAFIGPRPPGQQVCHNNGVAHDDRLQNLRYDTPKGNMADCVAHGTRRFGENHPHAKLTAKDVSDIRARAAGREPHAALAEEYGVHTNYISLVVTGKRWAA